MNPTSENSTSSEERPARKPYEKPELKRVDLALAETLGEGCKLGSDSRCVGPPITGYESGS